MQQSLFFVLEKNSPPFVRSFLLSLTIHLLLLLSSPLGMAATGGSGARLKAAKAIAATGIAVMGHTGLTPQAISSLGGFGPQVGFVSASCAGRGREGWEKRERERENPKKEKWKIDCFRTHPDFDE